MQPYHPMSRSLRLQYDEGPEPELRVKWFGHFVGMGGLSFANAVAIFGSRSTRRTKY